MGNPTSQEAATTSRKLAWEYLRERRERLEHIRSNGITSENDIELVRGAVDTVLAELAYQEAKRLMELAHQEAKRLTEENGGKTDSSGYSPPCNRSSHN